MMKLALDTSHLLSKTISGRVSARSGNDTVKCDFCGTLMRSPRGLSHHLRQNLKCREIQSYITSHVAPPITHDDSMPVVHKSPALPENSPSSPPSAESTTLPEGIMTSPNSTVLPRSATITPGSSPTLLESPMPSERPLGEPHGLKMARAGLMNAPLTTDTRVPYGQPFTGSVIPDPSPGSIASVELMAVDHLQRQIISMGFEEPLVFTRQPAPPPAGQYFTPSPHPQQPQAQLDSRGSRTDFHAGGPSGSDFPIPGVVPTEGVLLQMSDASFRDAYATAQGAQPQPLAACSSPSCCLPKKSHSQWGGTPATPICIDDDMSDPAPINQSPTTSTPPSKSSSTEGRRTGAETGPGQRFSGPPTVESVRGPTMTPAMSLRRNRIPKPNAPSIILLIQQSRCPLCRRDKPLPGERDMKSHIRSELPYRTTEGQVIMLRGYDRDLPMAFTINGQGYKNGILMCPFCRKRVQVVCGSHPAFPGNCHTCKSFLASGIAHIGAHTSILKNPRRFVPGHHDTCKRRPSLGIGCSCIPHYWTV